MKNNQYNRYQRYYHLRRTEKTGVSLDQYSNQNNIPRSTLYYWKNKLKQGKKNKPLLSLANKQINFRRERKNSKRSQNRQSSLIPLCPPLVKSSKTSSSSKSPKRS